MRVVWVSRFSFHLRELIRGGHDSVPGGLPPTRKPSQTKKVRKNLLPVPRSRGLVLQTTDLKLNFSQLWVHYGSERATQKERGKKQRYVTSGVFRSQQVGSSPGSFKVPERTRSLSVVQELTWEQTGRVESVLRGFLLYLVTQS